MSAWTVTANKGEGGGFEKAPAGNHPAVLVGLIDLGDQWQDGFQGADGKYQRRVYFVYELVSKKRTGIDANHLIAIDLTLSMNEKAKLRKWVEARTGKKIPDGTDYDIMQELGQPVLLNVVEKNGYPKIEGVSGIPDGFTVPAPKTEPTAWKLDPAKIDEIPGWVPYLYGESIKDVVRGCKQIKGDTRPSTGQPQYSAPPVGEEVPF